jgi:prevent-host-death family protein
MTITEARDHLADVVNEVAYAHRPVTLTRRGKPMAVIVSAEDYARIIDELEDAEDARLVDAARAEGGPTIPLEEIKHELGL